MLMGWHAQKRREVGGLPPSVSGAGATGPSNTAVILGSVRWNFMWQRHQGVAVALAKLGYRVEYVEPHPRGLTHVLSLVVRRLRDRVRRSSRRSRLVHDNPGVRVHRWSLWAIVTGQMRSSAVREAVGSRPDLLILYLPSRRNMRLLRSLDPGRIVYDDVMDWAAAARSSFPPRGWRRVVVEIRRWAEQGKIEVWTDSSAGLAKWRAAGISAELVMPKADDEFLQRNWRPAPRETKLGYFGTVRYGEVDVEYLAELSEYASVEIVGEIDKASQGKLSDSSVVCYPAVPLKRLVEIVETWSDVVLPYRLGPRSATLTPAKLMNALASERAVHQSGLSLPDPYGNWINDLPERPEQFMPGQAGPCPSWLLESWTDALRGLLAP